jgi:hypothetical protein
MAVDSANPVRKADVAGRRILAPALTAALRAPRPELTTLQLARRIATNVLRAGAARDRDSTRDAPTQSVLATLRRTQTWFMRYQADVDGTIIAGTARRLRARS